MRILISHFRNSYYWDGRVDDGAVSVVTGEDRACLRNWIFRSVLRYPKEIVACLEYISHLRDLPGALLYCSPLANSMESGSYTKTRKRIRRTKFGMSMVFHKAPLIYAGR